MARLAERLADADCPLLRERVSDMCEDYSLRELDLIADFVRRAADVAALCTEEHGRKSTGDARAEG